MFDGPEAWGICEPQREEVEERMWAAIQSWDINSRRNINYRCEVGRWSGGQGGLGQDALSQHGPVWLLASLWVLCWVLPKEAESSQGRAERHTAQLCRLVDVRARQHLRVPEAPFTNT